MTPAPLVRPGRREMGCRFAAAIAPDRIPEVLDRGEPVGFCGRGGAPRDGGDRRHPAQRRAVRRASAGERGPDPRRPCGAGDRRIPGSVADESPTAAHAIHYAKIVKSLAEKRRLRAIGEQLVEHASNGKTPGAIREWLLQRSADLYGDGDGDADTWGEWRERERFGPPRPVRGGR